MIPVQEEGDQTEEYHDSDLAHDLLAGENAQTESQKQQGQDPRKSMLLVSRRSEERGTGREREEIEEQWPLSRSRQSSGHADDRQQAQDGHNNRPYFQFFRLRPDKEAQHRSDNGNRGQQQGDDHGVRHSGHLATRLLTRWATRMTD